MLTDKNYISQAKVAMYSACKNTNPKVKIVFTIFCDKSVDRKSRERLFSLEKIFSNIKVNFSEIANEDFVYAKSEYRVPIVSYYRLIAAKILDMEKVLCLDSDLIVEMDLVELYEIDIENYYIAGVRDLYPILYPNFASSYAEQYNIKNFCDYINCGVLLMNLKLMRKDNIVEVFLNELKKKNLWLDQDIFNRVCSGRIRLIDWKYNHITSYTNEEYEWNYKSSEKEGIKEILHFCGPSKPWDNRFISMADKWWRVAKEALEKDIYLDIYRLASIGEGSKKMLDIASICMDCKTIIIVGYSNHGVFIRNALLKYGVTANILFCDNNPEKRKLMLIDKKIYSPVEAAKEYKEAIWVNSVQKQRNAIIEQLKELKIPDERIVNYVYE